MSFFDPSSPVVRRSTLSSPFALPARVPRGRYGRRRRSGVFPPRRARLRREKGASTLRTREDCSYVSRNGGDARKVASPAGRGGALRHRFLPGVVSPREARRGKFVSSLKFRDRRAARWSVSANTCVPEAGLTRRWSGCRPFYPNPTPRPVTFLSHFKNEQQHSFQRVNLISSVGKHDCENLTRRADATAAASVAGFRRAANHATDCFLRGAARW